MPGNDKRLAYEMIGHPIMTWGVFEQSISYTTRRTRDRHFLFPGKIEPGFYLRWKEWCRLHRAFATDAASFETFANHVRELSDMRDDIVHNITRIEPDNDSDDFNLDIVRHNFDWMGKFERWMSRYAHLPPKAHPPIPKNQEVFRYNRGREFSV